MTIYWQRLPGLREFAVAARMAVSTAAVSHLREDGVGGAAQTGFNKPIYPCSLYNGLEACFEKKLDDRLIVKFTRTALFPTKQ